LERQLELQKSLIAVRTVLDCNQYHRWAFHTDKQGMSCAAPTMAECNLHDTYACKASAALEHQFQTHPYTLHTVLHQSQDAHVIFELWASLQQQIWMQGVLHICWDHFLQAAE
jgi:hypothetical protein